MERWLPGHGGEGAWQGHGVLPSEGAWQGHGALPSEGAWLEGRRHWHSVTCKAGLIGQHRLTDGSDSENENNTWHVCTY